MSGLYTNQFQAVVLFDGKKPIHPSLSLGRSRGELLEMGLPLNITQESSDFALMMGANDLFVTIQYHDHPAEAAVMTPSLGSPYIGMISPDAAARLERHDSHAIVEVRQGVMPDMPELSSFLDKIDMPKPGHSLAEFNMRAKVTATFCADLIDTHGGTLVHWTPSNMLVEAEKFAAMAQGDAPAPIMVHPRLFAGPAVPGFKETPVGFYTLGAANYIGDEIHMMPAPVPWFDLFDKAMGLVSEARCNTVTDFGIRLSLNKKRCCDVRLHTSYER